MGVVYDRTQRPSINHNATIGDIPFEVIQKALRLLGRADRVSASLSSRAWRQSAVELIVARKRFNNEQAMGRFISGMMLKRIVFGFEQYSIKKLNIDMRRIGIDYLCVMAQTVAPTLSILGLEFKQPAEPGEPAEEDDEDTDLDCYTVVETFFASCLQIRDLRLEFFDFGDDPSSLTPAIMDGFVRLDSLDVSDCRGDLMMFADHVSIQTLSTITLNVIWKVASEIISAIAMKCRSLKRISLTARFNSWESIHKVFECCRDLEEIFLCD
jgi:hypothetical protein